MYTWDLEALALFSHLHYPELTLWTSQTGYPRLNYDHSQTGYPKLTSGLP